MKPEKKSKKVLNYTQAIAKMMEFDVSLEERKKQEDKMFYGKPEDLFSLVIGILMDYSALFFNKTLDDEIIKNQISSIRFCAYFFDNYKNTNRLSELDNYNLIIGASAYYLANLPGSSKVLCSKIKKSELNLTESKIEIALYWLLSSDLSVYDNEYPAIYNFNNLIKLVIDFFNEGIICNKKIIISKLLEFKESILNNSTNREILMFYLFSSILIKKMENSSIQLIPNFSDISLENWLPIIKKNSFVKELWPAQILLGENEIFKGRSAIIQMPTSAGKTKSTELIIRSAFLANRTSLVVIVAPFKSLCHEISIDYEKAFGDESKVKINEIDDILDEEQVELFSDKDKLYINVLTPEKLYFLIKINPSIVNRIGLIIFDEAHQFDSGSRGITFELLLTSLNSLLPSNCQKILISAVIGNSISISNWFLKNESIISGNNYLPTQRNIGFVSFKSIVDNGDIYFYNYSDLNDSFGYISKVIPIVKLPRKPRERIDKFFPEKEKKWPYINPNSIALYLGLKMCRFDCVAIYSGKKEWIYTFLSYLIDELYERKPAYLKPIEYSDKSEIERLCYEIEKNLGDENLILKCAKIGIFVHHADLPYGIKLAIEDAIHNSKIKFLICTSTLAQGVNLPIKYLFIPSATQGGDELRTRDFQNLIGRVGRAGKLTEGSIIFTNPEALYSESLRKKIFSLLNPGNTEDCKSSIFELFKPIKGKKLFPNEEIPEVNFENKSLWLDLYLGKTSLEKFANKFVHYDENHFPFDYVLLQLSLRESYIHSIESFILGLPTDFLENKGESIAKQTLAYYIADEEIKDVLVLLFQGLLEKIHNNVSLEKMNIYSKTMQGLDDSSKIEEFVHDNCNVLASSDFFDVFEKFWSLYECLYVKKITHNIPDINKLRQSAVAWLDGESFSYIYEILKEQKYKNRKIRIEDCVGLFENGFGYNGSILMENIKDFLLLEIKEDIDDKFLLFQKRIKYGLPSASSIHIYELGFYDRSLSQELSKLISNIDDIDLIKMELLQQEENVIRILERYPTYFWNVFERLHN